MPPPTRWDRKGTWLPAAAMPVFPAGGDPFFDEMGSEPTWESLVTAQRRSVSDGLRDRGVRGTLQLCGNRLSSVETSS
jgi:hypothetical protein